MVNWEAFFQSHILERGYQYFKSGAVVEISETDNGYSAIVEGAEDYEVEIELCGDKISEMFCSCPYAEDGSYCKHMAAVLYSLNSSTNKISKATVANNSMGKVQKVVEGMSEAETKTFLLDLVSKDSTIGNLVISAFSKSIGQGEIGRLKREIDNIVNRYAERDDFIDYHHANDFIDEIEEFLFDKVENMISNRFNMQAFELTTHIFLVVSNQDMDDSDGGTSIVATHCYELWEKILGQCNEEEKENMFKWFLEYQEGQVVDYMEEYITDFLMKHFDNRDFLLQKLELLDKQITAVEEALDSENLWSLRYAYGNNIVNRLEIMKRLCFAEHEMMDYSNKYRYLSAVREFEISEFLERKDYDRAIEVLLESKNLDSELPGLVDRYSRQLIELYRNLDMNEQYKKELVFNVFNCSQNNLEYINMLKECCYEEWGNYLGKLLREPTVNSIKYQLLEQEGMYERLLNEILKSESIYLLEKYEVCLKKEFPDKVRDVFVKFILKNVETANGRNRYRELAMYLKKIRKYPQGEETAKKIAIEWKEKYKRKTAMMDELRKAGF